MDIHSWIYDLRLADDLVLLATPFQETKYLLDEVVTCLAEVGLQLKVRRAKVLTTQSQSPMLRQNRFVQTYHTVWTVE